MNNIEELLEKLISDNEEERNEAELEIMSRYYYYVGD